MPRREMRSEQSIEDNRSLLKVEGKMVEDIAFIAKCVELQTAFTEALQEKMGVEKDDNSTTEIS